MDRIGNYDIIRELGRRQHAATYAARRTGDASDRTGKYAVKVFDTESVDLLSSVAGASALLERAKVQKALVDRGARHWAPIVEIGTTEEPFVVTALYPMSAERYLNRGAPAGARGLYTIIWSVVRGLTELRESFRRAHGNLRPSNVLIGGDLKLGSPKTTQVVLTDPAAEGTSARDRTGDLTAIGELIHLLVLKRPYREQPSDLAAPADPDAPTVITTVPEMPEWPIPMSPGWEKLGPDAQGWLELCNRLLSPRAAGRPADLVEVAVALHALTPKRKPLPWKWVAAAVVVLALGGAGAAWFRHVHAEVRSEYLAVRQQWFGTFAARLEDPGRMERYSLDPGLRNIVDAVRNAKKAGVRFDLPADAPLLSYGNYNSATEALAVARRVERELTPDRWQTLANVEAARRRYESRQWQQPATYLGTLAAGIKPSADHDVVAGIDRLLAGWSKASALEQPADAAWQKFESDLAIARQSSDPVVVRFATYLQNAAAAAIRLTDNGFEGLDAIASRTPLAQSLADLVKGGWPAGHQRARIAADLEAPLNVDAPTEDSIRRWLAGIDQYALIPLDPAAEPLKGLNQAYQQLVGDVTRQSQLSESEQAKYLADRNSIEAKVKSLGESKFVRRDVARGTGEVPLRVEEIRRELERMRKVWVRLDDPKQWLAFVDRPLPSSSDVLKQRWQAYIAGERDRLAQFIADPALFKQAKARADVVRELLAETGRQFPLGADGLGEALAASAFERRESVLRDVSRWADASAGEVKPPAPEVLEASVKAAGETYTGWTNKLLQLTKEWPLTAEVLLPTDRPDLRWAKSDPSFWADPVVQQYVKKDLDRISAVAKAAAASDRDELVRAAETAEPLEVALAAWRRLGELTSPAWPATPTELQKELDLRNRIARLTNAVQTQSIRDSIAADWRPQGPARWRTFTNSAVLSTAGADSAPLLQKLDAAVRFRTAMLVDEVEVAKLAPAARFNYALYVARVTVPDVGENVTRTAAESLRRSIEALGDRTDVKVLGSRLAKLNEPEPMATDARLLAPVPPATLNVPIRERFELTFVRVEPPGQRPFYLCTTELSLGQFIELTNASGNWAAANALLGNESVPGGTGPVSQRGPRLWERPAAMNAAIDRFAETWRYDTAAAVGQEFTFEPSLRQTRFNRRSLKQELGGNPSYDHPMQQLPAQAALYTAALAGCRLPTPREWIAAYSQERKVLGDAWAKSWNLRDGSWLKQAKFVAPETPSQWPSADAVNPLLPPGVFAPAGFKATGGIAAVRGTDDDGVLFFRPVNAGGGTFQNLVGNVAELVCDQADDWDHTADRRNVDVVKQFLQKHASQVMVIGGSAFSPPELELIKPTPVGAITEPWCDVGLRLAFTAPARSTAERLKWFIEEQPYLSEK